ncbi:hypothetical protein AZE42_10800 [Rhizopogon vesiculosus]|uniref:Uncharacterized protein n=1 Tax=Rhizopogon vesiculosus TaxID=180088 RepID=A0A1J8QCG1_9AGAM|nr:hypothetical protein AZE42_10800 [Rhizopogon vesiculosus]
MSKSDLLPTNFVGDNHGKGYKLYEMQLDNPDKTQYSLFNLSDFTPAARINMPIAAYAWNGLQDVREFDASIYVPRRQIRVYYITATSKVREIVYSAQVVGSKAPPWAPQSRTAAARMLKSERACLRQRSGSGSSLQRLPRLSPKLISLGPTKGRRLVYSECGGGEWWYALSR